jgi:hypothetical protein
VHLVILVELDLCGFRVEVRCRVEGLGQGLDSAHVESEDFRFRTRREQLKRV